MIHYSITDVKVLKNDKNFSVLSLGFETICISYDKVIASQIGNRFYQLIPTKDLTETNKKHLGIFKAMPLF